MIATKKHIQSWWNRNPCMSYNSKLSGRKYFSEIVNKRYAMQPWIHKLIGSVQLKDGSKLLEVGCGQGVDLLEFVKRGFSTTGADLSSESISLAREYFKLSKRKGSFLVSDAENLGFDDNSFDVVYSYGVLHHTTDTQKAIDEVHRVLKPGGAAIVMLYSKYSLLRFLHPDIRSYEGRKKTEKEKCPIVGVFSSSEARWMFRKFSEVNITKKNVGRFEKYLPELLKKEIGWHMIIQARK